MGQTNQLTDLEFESSRVKVSDWDLRIPIAPKAGPFCQLEVETIPGATPGVFAWVVTDKVIFVGHTDDLSLVAHQRGDFTSVTASTTDEGAAKINNLMNAAYKAEHRVSFWWRPEMSSEDAAEVAEQLIAEFDPMGNKLTRPKATRVAAEPAAPSATAPKTAPKPKLVKPRKYDAERVTPKNLICPSCFIQVPLASGWCDDCEIKVAV